MASNFETAAETLYGAPLKSFVDERKRLAGELKADDKAGAAALLKLSRPGQSAWAINQLFRLEKGAWDTLLEVSARIRNGELAATAEQRKVVAGLRLKAEALLKAEGTAASDQVLGRVETNLRSIAATGWGDVAPGRLIDDRAEPGFDALAGFAALAPVAPLRVVAPEAPKAPPPQPSAPSAAVIPIHRPSAEERARAKEAAEAEARAKKEAAEAAAKAKKEAEAREKARAVERMTLSAEVQKRTHAFTVSQKQVEHAQGTVDRLESQLQVAIKTRDDFVTERSTAEQSLEQAKQVLAAFDAES